MTALIDLNVDGYYVLIPHQDPVFHPTKIPPTLEQLQGLVGGFIELVYIKGRKAQAFVNEEGKLKGMPFNPLGDALYGNPYDPIVGTMVVCCGKAKVK